MPLEYGSMYLTVCFRRLGQRPRRSSRSSKLFVQTLLNSRAWMNVFFPDKRKAEVEQDMAGELNY